MHQSNGEFPPVVLCAQGELLPDPRRMLATSSSSLGLPPPPGASQGSNFMQLVLKLPPPAVYNPSVHLELWQQAGEKCEEAMAQMKRQMEMMTQQGGAQLHQQQVSLYQAM